MKKEFLSELHRMKNLFDYKKGVVISEQKTTTNLDYSGGNGGKQFDANALKLVTNTSNASPNIPTIYHQNLKCVDDVESKRTSNKNYNYDGYLRVQFTRPSGRAFTFTSSGTWNSQKSGEKTYTGNFNCSVGGGYTITDDQDGDVYSSITDKWNSDVEGEKNKTKFANSPYSCIVNYYSNNKIEGEPTGGNIVVNLTSSRWNFSSKGYWSIVNSKFEGNWKCNGNENFIINSSDGETLNTKKGTSWTKMSTTDGSTGTQGNSNNSSTKTQGNSNSSNYTTCPETFPIKKMCKNNKIKEIQVKLGMIKKYQTGNFGPKTEAAILAKVPDFKVAEGITQGDYDKIFGTTTSIQTPDSGGKNIYFTDDDDKTTPPPPVQPPPENKPKTLDMG